MEYLYKQMSIKGRNSSFRQENEDNNINLRDKRILPQKTQSFKGERKRSGSWLQRQFSKQMIQDYPGNGEEYEAAVAAAAFAITSLEEESRDRDRIRKNRGQDRAVNKHEEKSVKFSDRVSNIKSDVSEKKVFIATQTSEDVPPLVEKTPTFADHLNRIANTTPEITPIVPVPSMKKSSTFGDKDLQAKVGGKLGTKQAEIGEKMVIRPGGYNTEADSWEKAELAKIKEKYDKLDTTILKWETKKKTKAKRGLEKIEAEMDKKRAKAMQNYRDRVSRVDNIADGARAQAEENRRNEESKVKEKANQMSLTGRSPRMCFCF